MGVFSATPTHTQKVALACSRIADSMLQIDDMHCTSGFSQSNVILATRMWRKVVQIFKWRHWRRKHDPTLTDYMSRISPVQAVTLFNNEIAMSAAQRTSLHAVYQLKRWMTKTINLDGNYTFILIIKKVKLASITNIPSKKILRKCVLATCPPAD